MKLKNQDGVVSNRIRVKATQRIRDGLRLHGLRLRPHQQDAEDARTCKGASAGELNTRYETDPLMGGTSIHGNFVTFVKEA